jgi:hypothetical protein
MQVRVQPSRKRSCDNCSSSAGMDECGEQRTVRREGQGTCASTGGEPEGQESGIARNGDGKEQREKENTGRRAGHVPKRK